MNLGKKDITKEGPEIFFILEAGTNHYELADVMGTTPFEAAKQMIVEAANAGADAIKFQIYNADMLAHPDLAPDQYEYLRRHDILSVSDYRLLQIEAKRKKIMFLATLYDMDSVDAFGDELPIFKVASPDITNSLLLKEINKYKKPVLLSVGGANIDEIKNALVELINCQVVIMYCISMYPTPIDKVNFGRIKTLNRTFDNIIGYSHHNSSYYFLMTSVIMGANVIEVHFKTTDVIQGNDYPVSIMPAEAKKFAQLASDYKIYFGNEKIEDIKEEDAIREKGRRALYAKNDIPEGSMIHISDLIPLRPVLNNMPANQFSFVIGRKAKRYIISGEPIKEELLD